MYHRNDSISACIIHFIYISVFEDVIGSDVGRGGFLAHTVCVVYTLYSVSTAYIVAVSCVGSETVMVCC